MAVGADGVGRLAVGLVLTLGGCTLYANASRQQCHTDDDCAQSRTGVAGLACDQGVCVESQSADTGGSATSGGSATGSTTDGCDPGQEVLDGFVGVYDPSSLAALAGVDVAICNKLDVLCNQPVAQGKTMADGTFAFSTTPAFSGYVQAQLDGYAPQIVTVVPPVLADPDGIVYTIGGPFDGMPGAFVKLPMPSDSEVQILSSFLGATVDPTRGVVGVAMTKCLFEGKNRRVDLDLMDDQTVAYCLVDGVPVKSPGKLTKDGICGFINAIPGNGVMSLVDLDTQEVVRTIPVIIRPGWVGAARMR